jgi:hypothetical protein
VRCEPGNPPSERDINQVLAAVAGIGAKDEIEGLLATQMVGNADGYHQDAAPPKAISLSGKGMAVKLLRTFAAQVEALQRHRSKGSNISG